MSTKVSDFMAQRLPEWGVTRFSGYAGNGIMPGVGYRLADLTDG